MKRGRGTQARLLSQVIATGVSLLLLAACNEPGDETDPQDQLPPPTNAPGKIGKEDRFAPRIDSRMSDEEKGVLVEDLNALAVSDYKAKKDYWFDWVFGGTDAKAVNRYLRERITIIYGQDADIGEVCAFGSLRPNARNASATEESQVVANAFNLSVPLWFTKLKFSEKSVFCGVQRQEAGEPDWVEIKDSRAGVMQLGEGYYKVPKLKKAPSDPTEYVTRTPFERIGTLVHEARHSDCRDGVNPELLEAIKRGDELEDRSCGYLHVKCGEEIEISPGNKMSNPYAGHYACDGDPWGPYMVEGIFYMNYEINCVGCSEKQKQLTRLLKMDRLIRFWPMYKKLVDDQLGKPVMTSKGLVGAN